MLYATGPARVYVSHFLGRMLDLAIRKDKNRGPTVVRCKHIGTVTVISAMVGRDEDVNVR